MGGRLAFFMQDMLRGSVMGPHGIDSESVSVVIPTLNAAKYIADLIRALMAQALPPGEIIVIDSSSDDETVSIAENAGARVVSIARAKFNHGGTRNIGVEIARGDYVVFLSQDVMPVDASFLGMLTSAVALQGAAAAYARQIGGGGAKPPEQFLRAFNYPEVSQIRTSADIEKMGLAAFFFSNAASVYDRAHFIQVKGFPENVILAEDTLLCARLLRSGASIAYVAEAAVFHAHNYSLRQQFRRYFDTGVAHREARGELAGGARAQSGLQFAIRQVQWLWAHGHRRWLVFSLAESGTKFVGYHLGKRFYMMPRWLVRRMSMHRSYWR